MPGPSPLTVSGKKLDCTTSSVLPAHVNHLWPLVTDIARWPAWFRDAKGHGLASAEPVRDSPTGIMDPMAPKMGGRWRFAFTNGLAGEWEINYWVEPSQISLRLVPETRRDNHGLQHVILDLDFFPQPDGSTKLWFGALLICEPKFKPGLLARWPQREVMGWVEGFHQRVGAEVRKRGLSMHPKGEPASAQAAPGAR